MGLFSRTKNETLVAPVDGQLIQLDKVNDPVFAKKMMGDGFAIDPSNGIIVSPVKGTVSTVFPTKHAIMILSKDGLEIMLHLGIDTVELNGEPFEMKVREGNKISAGQIIANMDLGKIAAAKKDPTIMVIITDLKDIKSPIEYNEHPIKNGESVLTVTI